MKKIPLTQGKFAIVDNRDYLRVSKFKWYASCVRKFLWYAKRHTPRRNGKQGTILMHRLILDAPKGAHTDHINGNGLDNRRSNIRPCTNRQNCQNQQKRRGTSKFKGVCWHKTSGWWRAQIGHLGKVIYLGDFTNEKDAAEAYDKAAVKYFGEFANTNKNLGLL